MPGENIYRMPEVESRTGLSRHTIYKRIAAGAFPKPIKLGERASGYLQSEIDGWIDSRIAESRPDSSVA